MSLTHTHKWIIDNGKTLTTTEKVSLLIAVNADIKETQTASTNNVMDEILPMINSIREDLNCDALNSFYTNRACDNLDIVAAKLSAV